MMHRARNGHTLRERRVGIGEVAASATPILLRSLLGSCVSVCLHDPVSHMGGMNHILISSDSEDCRCSSRCGVQAMELLINEIMKLGCDRRRFIAKAFGGANVLAAFKSPTVGELNVEFVRRFLSDERIPLLAERFGGKRAIQVCFNPHSNRVLVGGIHQTRLPAIVHQEDAYYHSGLGSRFQIEEPTIF